jgi:uncharacterized membrane protein
MKHSSKLRLVIIGVLILGIAFRFLNLDRKIFWHDEVYTSMRAAGYTRGDVDQLFQNQMVAAPVLQQFQQIKPGSTIADTIRSLKTEDPQHPPLYFVMARLWMAVFGSAIAVTRVFPVLISLLSLPLMYKLAIELFASRWVAGWAMALLAISPFDILFAQTARQYSLLTLMVIGSSLALLRAMRCPSWGRWAGYGVAVAIGAYTHPFFALTVVGHGVFVALSYLSPGRWGAGAIASSSSEVQPRGLHPWVGFGGAIALSLLLYLPWIQVLVNNHQRATATTNWAVGAVPFSYLLKLWTLSFTSLLMDLDFGFDNFWTFGLRVPFVLLIVWTFYQLWRSTPGRTWLFVLTSVLVPFLLLVLPDLVLGGKRSAVSRYLISCYPGIQLAVAYAVARGLASGRRWWRGGVAIVLAASVFSCTTSALADTWWNKDLSYENANVIRLVNATGANPVLVSDIGDDFTNTGDLISLSYGLKETVRLFLMKEPFDFEPLKAEQTVLLFRPSAGMMEAIRGGEGAIANSPQGSAIQSLYEAGRLWQFTTVAP